ncbi:hypothetical protein Patl1_13876 [Pistacia atlantica]|uniref:Uncharacterized protein n=1 Tax=Pistacia atlantica TaxID=434234 RepID=A0ACC1AVT8_9ROSI|nr:hypothetical protein Patl1_13876 [Pistacia atlantica]
MVPGCRVVYFKQRQIGIYKWGDFAATNNES